MPPLDFNGLDTAVHGPVRFGGQTALLTEGLLDFTTLKKRLNVADGAMDHRSMSLSDSPDAGNGVFSRVSARSGVRGGLNPRGFWRVCLSLAIEEH